MRILGILEIVISGWNQTRTVGMGFRVPLSEPGKLDDSIFPSFASAVKDSLPCESHDRILQSKDFHCF